jgi:hypothetical protein
MALKSGSLGRFPKGSYINAEQAQRPAPPPHPKDEVQREELGRV